MDHTYSVGASRLLAHNDGACDAAARLGFDLNKVVIDSNGVARFRIDVTETIKMADLEIVKNYLRDRGASKVIVDSGLLANPKLHSLLARAADNGLSFAGGAVRRAKEGEGLSDFFITWNL